MTSSPPQQLRSSPFPLNSPNKLQWILEIPLKEICQISKDPESFYEPFPKNTGSKSRIIHNPTGALKLTQQKINQRILTYFPFPDFIIGGVKGKKLEDHLSLHLKRALVLTLDIKDCFPSITNKDVYRAWIDRCGAQPDTARLLTRLTTYHGFLPLGAPTSNLLANLVLLPCLNEINVEAINSGLNLSQFVDDSALSGDNISNDLIWKICKTFSKYGFTISRKKICVMRKSGSQQVTKRIVNQKLGFRRGDINNIRRAVYELLKTSASDPLYTKRLASVKGRIHSIKNYHSSIADKFLKQILTGRQE